jgi:hypothetical protein
LTIALECNNNCKHDQGGSLMIGIAVLGCGRIGAIHAANNAAHPRARPEGRAVKISEGV